MRVGLCPHALAITVVPSVVHSLPQLVVVWSYCRWREEAVEKMFDIVVYLVKELIVGVFEQLIERRQVWRTKSTALATVKKRVDVVSIEELPT